MSPSPSFTFGPPALKGLTLARAGTDRAAVHRFDPAFLAGLVADAGTRVLLVAGAKVAVAPLPAPPAVADSPAVAPPCAGKAADDGWASYGTGAVALRYFAPEELSGIGLPLGNMAGLVPETGDTVNADVTRGIGGYLGEGGGTHYAAAILPAGPGAPPAPGPAPELEARLAPLGPIEWVSLRSVGAQLADVDAGVATAATALAEWHRRERFCPRCGGATTVGQAGWVRHCTTCHAELYPRTDPAVIVAVTDPADRLLLSHSVGWASKQCSVQAGFVEAGEALEAAVRREVMEEVGLRLEAVTYLGSQAWPFPRSLMCAFAARAAVADVHVDGVELESARWFTRAEFGEAVGSGAIRIAPRSAIARSMMEAWYGEPLNVP
jgi:NAD+ diphosphatase